MDWALPDINGHVVIEEIKQQKWPVKVLVFSGYDDLKIIQTTLSAGAAGLILKAEKREVIVEAIRVVARGDKWVSPPIYARLTQQTTQEEEDDDDDNDDELTGRESEVLQKLAQGLTSKQIAIQLQIGPRTVKTRTANVYRKLGAQNKGDAVRIAGEKGWLKQNNG